MLATRRGASLAGIGLKGGVQEPSGVSGFHDVIDKSFARRYLWVRKGFAIGFHEFLAFCVGVGTLRDFVLKNDIASAFGAHHCNFG